MNKYDNARGARVTDALLNYETVKCFNNEELERQRLEDAIISYQNVEYKLMASLNGLNVLQSVIIFSGLIAGLVVCTKVPAGPAWAGAYRQLAVCILQMFILSVKMLHALPWGFCVADTYLLWLCHLEACCMCASPCYLETI